MKCRQNEDDAHAHHDLLEGSPCRGDTVGATATRWGSVEPGRFASRYRSAYGRSPGDTLRSRAAVTAFVPADRAMWAVVERWSPAVPLCSVDHRGGPGGSTVNTLPMTNRGGRLLCLFLEPYGEDYWLRPGETVTVVPASGATDPQFSLDVTEDTVVVWILQGGDRHRVLLDYTVVDAEGAEVGCGYQRPAAPGNGR